MSNLVFIFVLVPKMCIVDHLWPGSNLNNLNFRTSPQVYKINRGSWMIISLRESTATSERMSTSKAMDAAGAEDTAPNTMMEVNCYVKKINCLTFLKMAFWLIYFTSNRRFSAESRILRDNILCSIDFFILVLYFRPISMQWTIINKTEWITWILSNQWRLK